jgi:two-component system NtrC family response regulator
MPETILVVDDEPNYRLIIGQVLAKEGFEVVEAQNGAEALELFLDRPDLALVLTDITMPGIDGMELLTRVKGERPEVPVVMLTAHADLGLAVEAMRKGAFDYLAKPYDNEQLVRSVKKALEVFSLGRQNLELRRELAGRHSFGSLIGKSKPMAELYQLLEKVSPTRANVLITGESGTGKELVAKAVHYNSPRAERPFIAVNCSALPETLLVSELFGHEKGAFTGAAASRAGRFELAHRGTLFLDEVAEMGQSAQVTLLRVLQERTIERVGGGGTLIEVDVRLITATNRDLKAEAAAGRFREDLFFRLNVVHLKIPPLRDRLDDLPILVEHFIDKFASDRPRRPSVAPQAMRRLFAHRWPGNVRELENVIERALVMASGDVIVEADLPDEIRRPEPALQAGAAGPDASRPPAYGGGREGGLPGHGGGVGFGGASGAGGPGGAAAAAGGPQSGWPSAASPGQAPGGDGPGTGPSRAAGDGRGGGSGTGVFGGPGPGSAGGSAPPVPPSWAEADSGADEPPWMIPILAMLPQGVGLTEALSALEEAWLRLAMAEGGGVQSRAADSLGLKRNVFKYKWDKWASAAPTPFSERLAGAGPAPADLSGALAAVEEALLRRALIAARGVQSKAADLLGLKRSLMPYKLKKYPELASAAEAGQRPG